MSAWKHHGLFSMAVSMVGEAPKAHRVVMQRQSSRALVLNPSGDPSGAHAPPGIPLLEIVLDKAFFLIEGHPALVEKLASTLDIDGIRKKASTDRVVLWLRTMSCWIRRSLL